jgi:hypothetical protein
MGRGSLTGLYYVSTSTCQHAMPFGHSSQHGALQAPCQHASGLAALARQHFSFSLPCMTNRYQRQSGSTLVVASDDLLKC